MARADFEAFSSDNTRSFKFLIQALHFNAHLKFSKLDAKFHIGGKIAVAQSMLKMVNVGKSWKNG